METSQHYLQQAKAWLAQDPDNETHLALSQLIQAAEQDDPHALTELQQQFSSRLQFGTAGLRGPLRAGPAGMNRVLVGQTAAGLADYLCTHNTQPSIVIGCDARKNSAIFAQDTAEIMRGAGVDVFLLPEKLPTPVLAYAVRKLNASAGVMVTASHNPPQDNGYKVYLGGEDGGAQIVPPADKRIADAIEHVATTRTLAELPRATDYIRLDDTIVEDYTTETAKIITQPIQPLNYVYTAMHGVGCETLLRTITAAGIDAPILVAAQCTPDPTFPTVEFPNPEEPGALDLAIKQAQACGAEFIIANDPDADRLAVAIEEDGQWHSLHGNEVGCLLAWQAARQAQASQQHGTLACSLVSSPMLAKIATAYQLDFSETLTGFKWIGRVPNLIFGYEEALGYLVDPQKVHDKDGISAALAFLNLILELKAQGITLSEHREAFTQRFGGCASGQISVRVSDIQQIDMLLTAFRNHPMTDIAGKHVSQFEDMAEKNILIFRLDGGSRVIIRPSGTEPKVKIYLDAAATDHTQAVAIIKQLEQAMRTILAQYTA